MKVPGKQTPALLKMSAVSRLKEGYVDKLDSPTRSLLRDLRTVLVEDRQVEIDNSGTLVGGCIVFHCRATSQAVTRLDRLIARVDRALHRGSDVSAQGAP